MVFTCGVLMFGGMCLQVMTQAGGDVKEEVWKSFIVLLTNAPELHTYAARALFRALRQHLDAAQPSLLATATWYTGEHHGCSWQPGHVVAKVRVPHSLMKAGRCANTRRLRSSAC